MTHTVSGTHTIDSPNIVQTAKNDSWWTNMSSSGKLESFSLTMASQAVTGVSLSATGFSGTYTTMSAGYKNFDLSNEAIKLKFSNLSWVARKLRLSMGGLRLALRGLIVKA